jgi:chaperonin GroES
MKEQKMKTQETSSTLKEEVPKIKTGLLDKYEKEPVKEVTKETTKLPQPTGWRMLVLPFRMKEKTDGGVILGTETIDRQQVASQCGNVLAMGSDCYMDKDRFKDGPWCKVGDWVVFARYAGSRIEIEGGEVRLLNDDEILATVQDPTDILHKY